MPKSLLTVAVTLALAGPLAAQGLGELAAQEKARRARLKGQKARTFTDEDLKRDKPAATPGDETAGQGGQSLAPPETSTASDESALERAAEKAQWNARAEAARGEVREAEAKIAQIQDRIAALLTDREPTDLQNPFRLQTREAEIGKARQDLEAAQTALTTARKALADLEDEARRKSVPPGWLRAE